MELPLLFVNQLQASEDAQRGSRIILGTWNVACWVGIVLLWNGYFSWTPNSEIPYITKNYMEMTEIQKEVAKEKVKSWTKSRTSTLSLLGTSLDVDDIVPVCGISFLALSFWLNFCFMRELNIIRGILKEANALDTSAKDTIEIRKYIYKGLVGYSLFSAKTLPRNRLPYLLFTLLIFLPVIVSAVCFIFDVRSLFFPHYLRTDQSIPYIDDIKGNGLYPFLGFWYFGCLFVNILLVISCWKALYTSGEIDVLLTSFAVAHHLDPLATLFHADNDHIENYIYGWRRIFLALINIFIITLVITIHIRDICFGKLLKYEREACIIAYSFVGILFIVLCVTALLIRKNSKNARLFANLSSGFFRA